MKQTSTALHRPLVEALDRYPVIGILRREDRDWLDDRAAALAGAGIKVLEFSMTFPAALGAIARASSSLGEVIVGAGTVESPAQASAACAAGARFLLTPDVRTDVIEWAVDNGVPVIAGALTPTEVATAAAAGATAVKVFPARCFGPTYVRDLLGPFPDLRLVPVGGITTADAEVYMAAGAWAVGLGSALTTGERDEVTSRATALIDRLQRQ